MFTGKGSSFLAAVSDFTFYPHPQALEFANGLIMLKKKKLLIKCHIIKLAMNKSKKQILAFI